MTRAPMRSLVHGFASRLALIGALVLLLAPSGYG
jgi:hypothetical protein